MSPDQISTATALTQLISQIGTWPIGTWPIGSMIVVVVFGPWILMGVFCRSMEKRHEAVAKMYESNVKLVEKYERIADEQADTIRLSTAATTELITYLKTKTPCHQIFSERVHRS